MVQKLPLAPAQEMRKKSAVRVPARAALRKVPIFYHIAFTVAAGTSGDIKLTYPVPSANEQLNAFELTVYNNNGFDGSVDHCYINADLLRTNLNNIEQGADIGRITTKGLVFTGRSILVGGLSESVDFNTSYDWVDIELFRDSGSATAIPQSSVPF